MPRPRKDDPRYHQVNVRFTARELVRINHHASLAGKTLTDFGRTVRLRRPRPRSKLAPATVSLPAKRLRRTLSQRHKQAWAAAAATIEGSRPARAPPPANSRGPVLDVLRR